MRPNWEIRKGDIAIGIRNGEPELPRIVTLTGEIGASELHVSRYKRLMTNGDVYESDTLRNISHALFTEFRLLWRGTEEQVEVKVE